MISCINITCDHTRICLLGGVDFNDSMLVATFDVGDTRSFVRVPVFLDDDVEGEEEFMITVDVPPLYGGRVSAGDRITAIGVISDPDGNFTAPYATISALKTRH